MIRLKTKEEGVQTTLVPLESLVVEFSVREKQIVSHGYVEKYLDYQGERTKYKAVLKDGKLVGIVGTGYKVIPNEFLDELLKKVFESEKVESAFEGWRYAAMVGDDVLVVNSVNATLAFKAFAVVGQGVLVGSKVQNIYRRHTPKFEVTEESLKAAIEAIREAKKEYEAWLAKMEQYKASENLELIEALLSKLPKKYGNGILERVKLEKDLTIKWVYEQIARKIWSAELGLMSKLRYYSLLNDTVYMVVEWG
jgi:hypothetical protein